MNGCGHTDWAFGHCAEMDCPYYIGMCQLHSPVRTGDECNLRLKREWLVEVHDGTIVSYHALVVARSLDLALNVAQRDHGLQFLFSGPDFSEIVPQYLWQAGDGESSIEVRAVRPVPSWTSAGVVPDATPREKVT